MKRITFYLGMCVLLAACGGTTSSSTSSSSTGLAFTAAASFTTSAAAALNKATTATCSSLSANPTSDDPSLANGLDCDGDGGIVAHITPSQYSLAIREAVLLPANSSSSSINLIADTGTLANSQVVNFTANDTTETVVTIQPGSLAAGTYSGVRVKLYYFQMTMPAAGTTRNVRTYMSDDDFASEGSRGHHQGDITFIDDNGTELGWVDNTWLFASLDSTRSSAQNGAGGTDSETMHDRGFFGNTSFWNATDQMQGANQDVFVTTLTFDQPLVIPDPSSITNLTTVTVTFSVADTFYYEDFAPQNTEQFPGFYPDTGGEAKGTSYEWAPLAPEATITYSSN